MLRTTSETTRASSEYSKGISFEETEKIYLSTYDYMTECREELEPVVSHNQSLGNALSRIEGPSVSLHHLPLIKIAPFDGNLGDWTQFRDSFTSLIIGNKELNSFARMHFLKSSLKGTALESIANLTVAGDNFELAWNALTTRYENPRRMLSLHLHNLLTLPTVTRKSSFELQALRDKVSISVASLLQLNQTPDELWNDIILHVTVQKLDQATRKAWNLKTSDSEVFPSYETLIKFLTSRAHVLEECSVSANVKANLRLVSTTRVHVANSSAASSKSCPLCHAKHFINVCPAFQTKTPGQRRDLVKQHNRCFNCLSGQHLVNNCQSKYSCRLCRQTSLHAPCHP